MSKLTVNGRERVQVEAPFSRGRVQVDPELLNRARVSLNGARVDLFRQYERLVQGWKTTCAYHFYMCTIAMWFSIADDHYRLHHLLKYGYDITREFEAESESYTYVTFF